MTIVFISDIHGDWSLLEDIVNSDKVSHLFVLGDICTFDRVDSQKEELSKLWQPMLANFENLECAYIIPGNHDYWIQENLENDVEIWDTLGTNTKIMVDSFISVYGWNMYAIPGSNLSGHAFGLTRRDIIEPTKPVDILLTHEPPKNLEIPYVAEESRWYDAGSTLIEEIRKEHLPEYCVCGHLHSGGGISQDLSDGTTVVNVAQHPWCIEFE